MFQLHHRVLISLTGSDRATFLQGIITNDVKKITNNHLLYALLLTPNGRFLHDLFIFQHHDAWLIDCETNRYDELITHLKRYKLRSNIGIELLNDWYVFANSTQIDEVTCLTDPRHPSLGVRFYINRIESVSPSHQQDYINHEITRITHGIPDGSRDMHIAKSIPLECNMKELSAIDWQKGCYMGQEFTARTNYLGQIRKRLLPVQSTNYHFQTGDIISQNNEEVGEVRSVSGNYALVLLRLSALASKESPLICNSHTVNCFIPDWLKASIEIPSKD